MMQVTNEQPFEVVFTFVRHPYFGMLIEANAVQLLQNGDLSLTYQRIREKNCDYYRLTGRQAEAVKLIEDFENEVIIKKFYKSQKRIRPAEFFTKHYTEELHKQVRQYIETKLCRILDLVSHDPLFLSNESGEAIHSPVRISEEHAKVLFHFRKDESGTNYFITIRQDGEKIEFYHNNSELIISNPAWLLTPGGLHHFAKHVDGNKLKPFLNRKYIHIEPRNEEVYMDKFVKPLLENHDVYAVGFEIVTEQFNATPVLKLMSGFGDNLYLALYFEYGNWTLPYHVNKRVNVSVEKKDNSFLFHRVRRSFNWENEKIGFLTETGLENVEGSLFRLRDVKSDKALLEWLNRNADVLERAGFVISQENSQVTYYLGHISMDVQVTKESDWFDIKVHVQFGKFSVPFMRLRKHILENRSEYILPDGSVAIIPEEWFARFGRVMYFGEADENSIRLRNIHFTLLEDLEVFIQDAGTTASWDKIATTKELPHYALPDGMKAELRDYQHDGYNWIRFLFEHKIGPLLADDMGLGKTLQTLAALQYLKLNRKPEAVKTSAAKSETLKPVQLSVFEMQEGAENEVKTDIAGEVPAVEETKLIQGPSLVVAPKSLLYNWKAEAARFVPGLKVEIYHGVSRQKMLKNLHKADLVLMSYGTMRNDTTELERFQFNCIVLDESQAIKNPSSLTARNLLKLKAEYRIALTGTPIENTLLDIWSQMHFLNPGLLGSFGYFEKHFIKPIEKSGDQRKRDELKKLLDPFVLRRTKKQVASELPEKVEKLHFCEMTDEQAEIYERVKSQYRNEILGHVQEVGIARSRLKIFNGLMHLRQLALNPGLKDEDYTGGSGKDEEIRHMLFRAIEGKHKVLVFSQFISYLSIIREMLASEGVNYCYLDGSMDSKERAEQINKFQNDASVPVFLLSLRAGNSGINLTAADYVFLADPWWNPFTMKQAEDRAHRIGQDKTVFSYSFITRNTIEEKILKLQQRKKELAESIIPDEDNILAQLDEAELRDLLE